MDKYRNYIEHALDGGEPSRLKIAQFIKNYSVYFPKDKNSNILDIGPGKGEMLMTLSSLGFTNMEAIDISQSVVDYVENLNFKCTISTNTVAFLQNKKEYYSLVTMCDVVEHISKDEILNMITTIYSSLKKDGILIVQMPNMQSIVAPIFMYDDFTHEAGYTERSLIQMLKMCGFSSIECFGFEFLDNSIKSKIHYYLRAILWFFEKIRRKINGTMPHKIMHPVFFAIARK